MPSYAYVTVTQAVQDLSARLYDAANQLYSVAELQAYIQDAVQTWNALTSFYRQDMSFPLVAATPWYDLSKQANTARPNSLTDLSQINLIEYALLEPLTQAYPLTWSGSLQFTLPDILAAWTDKQNEALGTAGCTLTIGTIAALIQLQGLTPPDTTLVLRRVAWIPNSGFGYGMTIMRQSDAWAKQAYDPAWTTQAQAPPRNWMQSTELPPTFDVDRVPPVPGAYELLISESGPASVATQSNPVAVPNDWAWAPRWGALARLLSHESNANDAMRAKYAESRFQQGMAVMASSPSVLALRINNIPRAVDSVRNADDYNAGWEGAAAAPPRVGYLAGLNLIAFPPVDAPAGGYSATCSVVAAMPLFQNGGSYLQIARDDYDSVMDEAQHVAMFKVGGQEFANSMGLHGNFVKRAALYNSKLKEMGFYAPTIYEASRDEDERNPQYGEGQPSGVLNG